MNSEVTAYSLLPCGIHCTCYITMLTTAKFIQHWSDRGMHEYRATVDKWQALLNVAVNLWVHEMWGISWLTDELLASHKAITIWWAGVIFCMQKCPRCRICARQMNWALQVVVWDKTDSCYLIFTCKVLHDCLPSAVWPHI